MILFYKLSFLELFFERFQKKDRVSTADSLRKYKNSFKRNKLASLVID